MATVVLAGLPLQSVHEMLYPVTQFMAKELAVIGVMSTYGSSPARFVASAEVKLGESAEAVGVPGAV